MQMPKKALSTILALTACLALAACGGGAKEPEDGGAYRGIYVSTNDCANDQKMTFEICADAINKAIEAHTSNPTKYTSLRACEAKVGENKCERGINEEFRPRLMAYLVVLPKPPKAPATATATATALYPAPDGEEAFQDAKAVVYLETDLTLNFSKRAIAAFKIHSKPKTKKRTL